MCALLTVNVDGNGYLLVFGLSIISSEPALASALFFICIQDVRFMVPGQRSSVGADSLLYTSLKVHKFVKFMT